MSADGVGGHLGLGESTDDFTFEGDQKAEILLFGILRGDSAFDPASIGRQSGGEPLPADLGGGAIRTFFIDPVDLGVGVGRDGSKDLRGDEVDQLGAGGDSCGVELAPSVLGFDSQVGIQLVEHRFEGGVEGRAFGEERAVEKVRKPCLDDQKATDAGAVTIERDVQVHHFRGKTL